MDEIKQLPTHVRVGLHERLLDDADTLERMGHPDDRRLAEGYRVLADIVAGNPGDGDPGPELELRIYPWQALDDGQRARFLSWLKQKIWPGKMGFVVTDAITTLSNLAPAAVQSRAWPEGKPNVASVSAHAGDPTLAPVSESEGRED